MPNGQNNLKKFPYKDQGLELKTLRGTQTKKKFALQLKIPYRTYLRYESGERKMPAGHLELARIKTLSKAYNKPLEDLLIAEDHPQYGPQRLNQLLEGIKHIYNSQNPILVQAISLNIMAFQLAIKQMDQQKKDIESLKNICKKVEERLERLEEQLARHEKGAAATERKEI